MLSERNGCILVSHSRHFGRKSFEDVRQLDDKKKYQTQSVTTYEIRFTHRKLSLGEDQAYISLNKKAETKYHPSVCIIGNGKTCSKVLIGGDVVLEPICN